MWRTKDKNQRLLESAKKAAQTDLASLPKVEKDADASSTGDKNVGVGLAYLGYQQYDKALADYRKVLELHPDDTWAAKQIEVLSAPKK